MVVFGYARSLLIDMNAMRKGKYDLLLARQHFYTQHHLLIGY